ncbi:asparagine synthase (glutamine-hydrolyzing) [Thermodesulfobacteriota bacterium]
MCGICGFFLIGHSVDYACSLMQMNRALRHRGPDDEGFAFIDPHGQNIIFSGKDSPRAVQDKIPILGYEPSVEAVAGIAHRRFSIIDITPKGHQPFVDLATGNMMVFNGEIYNYPELREELINLGHGPFETASDTEVALRAYRAWGIDCFRRFNGFWAIAILDAKNDRLVLSRDRFGKKPLYLYYHDAQTLFFSSEIRSLISALPEKRFGLNSNAAMLYLLYDRRNTLEGCMWEGIELFPPGKIRIIERQYGKITEKSFWTYPDSRLSESDISMDEAVDEFRERFRQAVSLRLRADVPLSANLSGGMDSSAIVGVAQDILGKHNKLETNIIRYPDAPELDENDYANAVALKSGCNHSELFLRSDDFWSNLDELIGVMEEPVHTPAFFTQWLGWQHIAKQGFKVILHGAAGDELLGGYPYHWTLDDCNTVNRYDFSRYFSSHSCKEWRSHLRMAKWMMKGMVFPGLSNPLRRCLGKVDRRQYNRDYEPDLFSSFFTKSFLEKTFDAHTTFNRLYIDADSDMGTRMREDFAWLRIPFWCNTMDKSMMSLPVEIRMPFLDYKLVEFAMTLPVSYIYHNGWTKYVLRRATESLLPPKVVWRKQKMGFTAPTRKWLNERKDKIMPFLLKEQDYLLEFIRLDKVTPLYESIPEKLLWRIINFAMWRKRFSVK